MDNPCFKCRCGSCYYRHTYGIKRYFELCNMYLLYEKVEADAYKMFLENRILIATPTIQQRAMNEYERKYKR